MSGHACPARGCSVQVPSSMLACRPHWFSLPRELRDRVWRAYRRDPLGPAHLEAIAEATAILDGTTP